MANWCENRTIVECPTSDVADRITREFDAGESFGAFMRDHADITRDGLRLKLWYLSRNVPPFDYLRAWEAEGCTVTSLYCQPAERFGGCYEHGADDRVEFETRADVPDLLEVVCGPETFDDMFVGDDA